MACNDNKIMVDINEKYNNLFNDDLVKSIKVEINKKYKKIIEELNIIYTNELNYDKLKGNIKYIENEFYNLNNPNGCNITFIYKLNPEFYTKEILEDCGKHLLFNIDMDKLFINIRKYIDNKFNYIPYNGISYNNTLISVDYNDNNFHKFEPIISLNISFIISQDNPDLSGLNDKYKDKIGNIINILGTNIFSNTNKFLINVFC